MTDNERYKFNEIRASIAARPRVEKVRYAIPQTLVDALLKKYKAQIEGLEDKVAYYCDEYTKRRRWEKKLSEVEGIIYELENPSKY